MSGDHRGHQSHALALVKMTAQTIENHLSFEAYPGAIEMRFHSRPEFISTLCEGLALLDAQGRALTANRSAEFQLGLPLPHLIGLSFDSIVDRFFVQALATPARTVELITQRGVRVVAILAAPQASVRRARSLARPRRETQARGMERGLGDGRFRLDAKAERAICSFLWPGNLHQLSNVLRSALALATPDPLNGLDHRPDEVAAARAGLRGASPQRGEAAANGNDRGVRLGPLSELELGAIRSAIEACGGNTTAAARQLGLGRATLYRKLQASA
jgi:transcriptional regulator of acetoin/glycerol metabolism